MPLVSVTLTGQEMTTCTPEASDSIEVYLSGNIEPVSIVQIAPGKVTLVYGPMSAGKSEFTQAMACNLAKILGLKTALCLLDQQVIAAKPPILCQTNNLPYSGSLCTLGFVTPCD